MLPKSGTDLRSKIVHNFSLWAAMSAARQGCPVRGKAIYPHLNRVNFDELLDKTDPVSDAEFSNWHRRAVESLAESMRVPTGWAAKLVNIVLKMRVFVGGDGHHSLRQLIHPPIDNGLVKAIREKYSKRHPRNRELRSLCDAGKPIKAMATYEQYLDVVRGLKMIAERECWTLFEVESLWKPQNESSEDEDMR
jgi:hypothetical protein